MVDFKSGVPGGFGKGWKGSGESPEGKDAVNAHPGVDIYTGHSPEASHTLCPGPHAFENPGGGWSNRGFLHSGGEAKAPLEEGLQGKRLQANHRQESIAGAVSTIRLPYGSITAMAISGLVIGAGVPVALFYMAFKIGTWPFLVAATILGAIAIFWGAIMVIVASSQ